MANINITKISNGTGFADLAQTANDVTGGIFWGVILIVIFAILIFRLVGKGYDTSSSIAVASFCCLLLSLPLLAINLVVIFFSIFFALVLVGCLIYLKMQS